MSTTTYLITGANRGIGLEYVKQILAGEAQAQIIASVRHLAGADELAEVAAKYEGRVAMLEMDQVSFVFLIHSTCARVMSG